MVFHGKPRGDISKVHESPLSILFPIGVLSLGAVLSGWLGKPIIDTHHDFWNETILVLQNHNALENAHYVPIIIKIFPIIVALIGIFLAFNTSFNDIKERAKSAGILKEKFLPDQDEYDYADN